MTAILFWLACVAVIVVVWVRAERKAARNRAQMRRHLDELDRLWREWKED